jgi:predicted AlkP superfamily phosphohydrolase/phosphomutase
MEHNTAADAGTRVLLVGWDAAEWGLVDSLMAAGRLPHLKALVDRGWRGRLYAPPPLLSPVLWTSLATGMPAHEHGVHGHAVPWRNGRGTSPADATVRTAAAMWDVLAGHGLASHVVGWPVSHPTEPTGDGGVMVSDRFVPPVAYALPHAPGDDADAVHPSELAVELLPLCRRAADVDAGDLREMIPEVDRVDRSTDRRPATCAGAIAEAESIAAIAEHLMRTRGGWRLTAVVFPGLERLARRFMEYHPPPRPGVPEADFALYAGVMSAAYVLHDALLGRLVAAAGKGTTVMLVSDHGFRHDETRPPGSPAAARPSQESMAATWHTPQAMAVIAAGDASGDRAAVTSIFDIAPTTLALLGVPPRAGGSTSPGPSRARLRARRDWRDPAERAADEAVRHLIELGYTDPPDPDSERAVER